MAHGLECKKGGIRTQSHDEIKFELQDLAARAFIPFVIRDEPQSYPGRSADVEETEGTSTSAEERGDLLIRNLWEHQTDCILDVRITNAKRRNTSQPAWTSAVASLPLWFNAMEFSKRKPR